jgi:hypothetical protein
MRKKQDGSIKPGGTYTALYHSEQALRELAEILLREILYIIQVKKEKAAKQDGEKADASEGKVEKLQKREDKGGYPKV